MLASARRTSLSGIIMNILEIVLSLTLSFPWTLQFSIYNLIVQSNFEFRVLLILHLCFINLQLNRHINTHNGEKLFKCGLCNYGTDHSTNYRRHMERHTRKQGTSKDFLFQNVSDSLQLYEHGQIRPEWRLESAEKRKILLSFPWTSVDALARLVFTCWANVCTCLHMKYYQHQASDVSKISQSQPDLPKTRIHM